MSIDRWNQDDRARLSRIEEKLDRALEPASALTVVNTSAQDDPKCAAYGPLRESSATLHFRPDESGDGCLRLAESGP